jgi:hypothetical protein
LIETFRSRCKCRDKISQVPQPTFWKCQEFLGCQDWLKNHVGIETLDQDQVETNQDPQAYKLIRSCSADDKPKSQTYKSYFFGFKCFSFGLHSLLRGEENLLLTFWVFKKCLGLYCFVIAIIYALSLYVCLTTFRI